MTAKTPPEPKPDPKAARRATALKQNLARRKAAQRAPETPGEDKD